jgi:hypothetical protein
VPSDYVAKTFGERGYGPQRWVRHRYGYDPKLFTPPEDAGRPAADRPFTAVFAGSCEPRKGLHYAVRAWHDSGAAASGRLLVAGAFIPGYAEAIGAATTPASNGSGSRESPDLLRAADVLRSRRWKKAARW